MTRLPYSGHPSDDIHTQVKLFIPLNELDGKYKAKLEEHLRSGQFAQGFISVELSEETKNIFRITFVPTAKNGKTKPALTDARNALGVAVNEWYRANVK